MTSNHTGGPPYEHWEPYDANAALRNQVIQTRADLGDTLAELAARADVKARAREAVAQARERTRDALRARIQSVSTRGRDAARTGASSARGLMDRAGSTQVMRFGGTPLMVVMGAGAGALAGFGIYALLRNRRPTRRRSLGGWR